MNAAEAFHTLARQGRIQHFKTELGLHPFSEAANQIIKSLDQEPEESFEDGFFVLKIDNQIYHEGGYKPPEDITTDLPLEEFLNQFLTKQTANVTPQSS